MNPVQQTFDSALRHHQAGRWQEAQALYQKILTENPKHADAMQLLGVIGYQTGNFDSALKLLNQAIALNSQRPEYFCNLGLVLAAVGRSSEAIDAYQKALQLRPEYPEAQNNLGVQLVRQKQFAQAIAAYRQAIAVRPDYVEAYHNFGTALQESGQTQEAIAAYQQAIKLRNNFPEAHNNLGNAYRDLGQWKDAIDAYRKAIAQRGDFVQATYSLAIALQADGQIDESIAAFRRTVTLRPDFPLAFYNLGRALQKNGRLDEAITAFGQSLSVRPDHAESHNKLGAALRERGRFDEAVAAFLQAIHFRPNFADADNNLAIALKEMGRLDEALDYCRRAMAAQPENAIVHSNYLMMLHYSHRHDAAAILRELKNWDEQHAKLLRKSIRAHDNPPSADKKLRIGYVSPDFRDHVVGRNLLPLLREHDHTNFEIFCYANVPHPDAFTEKFIACANGWHDIAAMSDDQAAQLVRDDRIDILVDLTGHTANHRLLLFARKPAPLQVTFGGYPGGTGLQTMDYHLTDPFLDPPGSENHYVEQLIRLRDSFWCYDPAAMDLEDTPPVQPLPALGNRHITFGCLNNRGKISDRALELWARVFKAVPNSRLLLMVPDGSARQLVVKKLDGDSARIEFVGRQPRRNYFQTYDRMDIGLDSLPYNGHTTSLDSFWMGVPIVTRIGDSAPGRAGWSHLCNLDLKELAAPTDEDFIKIAANLAADLPRLSQLRASLREKMLRSPLTNAKRFAQNIETAYREIWRRCHP
jgi:protein O-GlcNAc transferase